MRDLVWTKACDRAALEMDLAYRRTSPMTVLQAVERPLRGPHFLSSCGANPKS